MWVKLKRKIVGIVNYQLELTEDELLTIIKALGKTNEDAVPGSHGLYKKLDYVTQRAEKEGDEACQ